MSINKYYQLNYVKKTKEQVKKKTGRTYKNSVKSALGGRL